MSTQVEDGLVKAHQDTKAGILADVNIPKRVVCIASDSKRLLLKLEDGNWVEFPSVAHGSIHAEGGDGEIDGKSLKGLRDTSTPIFASLVVAAAAGTIKGLYLRTAGLDRWIFRTDNTAEAGNDAGAGLDLIARHDDGSSIDSILSVVRAAGGTIYLGGSTNRHLRISAALSNDLLLQSDFSIKAESQDANDQQMISLCGGGANSPSRGGAVSVRGNERASTGGTVVIAAGDGVEGSVKVLTGPSSDERIVFLKDGKIKLPGHTGSGVRLLAVDTSGFIVSGATGSVNILDGSVTSAVANGPLLQFGTLAFPANFWAAGKIVDLHGFVKSTGGGLISPFFKGDGAEESLEAFNDAGTWEFRIIIRCIAVASGVASFTTSYWINGTGNMWQISSVVTVSNSSSFFFKANAYTIGVIASLSNFYAKTFN